MLCLKISHCMLKYKAFCCIVGAVMLFWLNMFEIITYIESSTSWILCFLILKVCECVIFATTSIKYIYIYKRKIERYLIIKASRLLSQLNLVSRPTL